MGSVLFQGSVSTSWGTQTTDVRVDYAESYDGARNVTTVSVTGVYLRVRGSTSWGTQVIKGSVAINGVTVCSFSPGTSTAAQLNVSGDFAAIPGSTGQTEVAHNSDGTGSFTVALNEAVDADLGGIFGFWYGALGKKIGVPTSVSQSAALTARTRASTIASCPGGLFTGDTLSLTVNRSTSAYYHKASFSCGLTTLYTSDAFASSLSFTVPRSWFSASPAAETLEVSVSVQTYTDSSCVTAVGGPAAASLTVTADEGMRPTLSSGWASAAPYNAGTPAASIDAFVKGYSRAEISFDASRITHAVGASLGSYSVSCQGVSVSGSPCRTGVLSAAGSLALVCTVTDSRGRSSSETLTLSVLDYARPSLSGIGVFRCTSAGTADEAGTYYSVSAAVSFSALGGSNTCSLRANLAASGGSYGSNKTLTSGTPRVLGTISADKSYTVRITATDSLGNSAVYYAQLPTRKWAMKFRPNGRGVAFGKAAESDDCFEIAEGWAVRSRGIVDLIYPVGSLYLSVNGTSPATLFGGTWERIMGRFLLAAGDGYAAGATGGAAAHSHATGDHTLTLDEMPSHRHVLYGTNDSDMSDYFGGSTAAYGIGASGTEYADRMSAVGGGQAHSHGDTASAGNLPPYLAVYIWKRTA